MALVDFTLSNARRFYSSMGNPLGLKGLNLIQNFVILYFNLRSQLVIGMVPSVGKFECKTRQNEGLPAQGKGPMFPSKISLCSHLPRVFVPCFDNLCLPPPPPKKNNKQLVVLAFFKTG